MHCQGTMQGLQYAILCLACLILSCIAAGTDERFIEIDTVCTSRRSNQPCNHVASQQNTWSEAKVNCGTLKGNLTTMSSPEVWRNITNAVKPGTYWIGAKLKKNQAWLWSDGWTENILQGCYKYYPDNGYRPDVTTSISKQDFMNTIACRNECSQIAYRYAEHVLLVKSGTIFCRCVESFGKLGEPNTCMVQPDGTINTQSDIALVVWSHDAANAEESRTSIDGEWDNNLLQQGLSCAYLGPNAKLKAEDCLKKRPYICQHDLNRPHPPCQISVASRCFTISTVTASWFNSHHGCALSGGKLFSFEKNLKGDELLMSDRDNIFRVLQDNNGPWIDLSKWTIAWDNKEFKRFGFGDWSSIQQNNIGAPNDCLALDIPMDNMTSSTITNIDCNKRLPFICSLENDVVVTKIPSTTPQPTPGTSTRNNIIIGITVSVVASILLTIIVNLILYSIRRHRRRQKDKNPGRPTDNFSPSTVHSSSNIIYTTSGNSTSSRDSGFDGDDHNYEVLNHNPRMMPQGDSTYTELNIQRPIQRQPSDYVNVYDEPDYER